MKLILFATFLVVCTASTLYRGKNISVNDDGSILMTSSSGKRVVITRPVGVTGRKNIDITITGPNIPTKRIQIDDDDNLYDAEFREGGRTPWSSVNSVDDEYRPKRSSKKDKSQGDVLCDILKEYQGSVDEPLYEKLLGKIEKASKKGEISRQIYDLLVGLDQGDETAVLSGIDRPRGYGYGPSDSPRGYGYGQSVLPRSPLYWYNREIPQGQSELYGDSPYGLRKGQQGGFSRFVNPLLEKIYYQQYKYPQYYEQYQQYPQYQQYEQYPQYQQYEQYPQYQQYEQYPQYQQYQQYPQYQQYQQYPRYQQYQQYQPSQVEDLVSQQLSRGIEKVFPRQLSDIVYNLPLKQTQRILGNEYLKGTQQYQQVPYGQGQSVGGWSRVFGRPGYYNQQQYQQPLYEGVQGQGQPIIRQNGGVYRENLGVPQVGY